MLRVWPVAQARADALNIGSMKHFYELVQHLACDPTMHPCSLPLIWRLARHEAIFGRLLFSAAATTILAQFWSIYSVPIRRPRSSIIVFFTGSLDYRNIVDTDGCPQPSLTFVWSTLVMKRCTHVAASLYWTLFPPFNSFDTRQKEIETQMRYKHGTLNLTVWHRTSASASRYIFDLVRDHISRISHGRWSYSATVITGARQARCILHGSTSFHLSWSKT